MFEYKLEGATNIMGGIGKERPSYEIEGMEESRGGRFGAHNEVWVKIGESSQELVK